MLFDCRKDTISICTLLVTFVVKIYNQMNLSRTVCTTFHYDRNYDVVNQLWAVARLRTHYVVWIDMHFSAFLEREITPLPIVVWQQECLDKRLNTMSIYHAKIGSFRAGNKICLGIQFLTRLEKTRRTHRITSIACHT